MIINFLKVLIVDDEPPARERLRHLLSKIENIEIIGEAENGNEAIKLAESLEPDVILLDIHMPDIDGLKVLEALDDPPAVIFSTAYDNYAVKAFDLEAVDYLLKPYSSERLRKALEKAERYLSGKVEPDEGILPVEKIPLLMGNTTEFVPVEKIECFYIVENVVFVLCEDGQELIYEKSLNYLESILPSGKIFRVSRQALVNINSIKSFSPNKKGGLTITLIGGREELVSRRRSQHLKSILSK